MTEEVVSPPFPSKTVSYRLLYKALTELRAWVHAQRKDLNAWIGEEHIPTIQRLPGDKDYVNLPIVSLYSHLVLLRRIREMWDKLIRQFEHHWNDDACLRQRVSVVQAAATLLNNAFVPLERREAGGMTEMEEMQTIFSRVQAAITAQLESDHDEDD